VRSPGTHSIIVGYLDGSSNFRVSYRHHSSHTSGDTSCSIHLKLRRFVFVDGGLFVVFFRHGTCLALVAASTS
jgi:hypothetical protein